MVAKLKQAAMCMLTDGTKINGELFLKLWNEKTDVRLTPRAAAAILADMVKRKVNTLEELESIVSNIVDCHRKGTVSSNGPYLETQIQLTGIGDMKVRGLQSGDVATYMVELEEDVASTCHSPALVTIEGIADITGQHRFDKRVLGDTMFHYISDTILESEL